MPRYEIAFSGQIRPGFGMDEVKGNLMNLFQCDAQRIEALFSGRRVIIKPALDQESVEKYRQVLLQAGAEIEINESAAPAVPDYRMVFQNIQAPSFGMAPPGSDLQDIPPTLPVPHPDLSAFSLAPPGSDLGQQLRPSVVLTPDISTLKLVD